MSLDYISKYLPLELSTSGHCMYQHCFFCHRLQVDVDTVWNELYTSAASRIAAGCVTDLALRVAQGELKVCLLTKYFIGN